MQQKLIVTLWKAQFKDSPRELYCRLTYNSQERNSKSSSPKNNLIWKETFIFSLAKQHNPLKLEFISLKPGQEIHYAKDQIASTMSFGASLIPIDGATQGNKGSIPCKVDIFDERGLSIGKIFIEYEIIKTQVEYTVDKQLDYFYLLKLNNFRVNFVRNLKKTPYFYLKFTTEGRTFRENLPFEEQSGTFTYNYPVKLYLKKEVELEIELDQKDYEERNFKRRDNLSDSSSYMSSEIEMSSKKSERESITKRDKNMLELGPEKITAVLDLNFKRDFKTNKKLPLTVPFKYLKRQIGSIEFQMETTFRSKQELLQLEEQKKGVNNPESNRKVEKKKVGQGNGAIVINSILGKLELFNEGLVEGKDLSAEIKMGKQIQISSTLETPGKQLIFIDTFTFKRTWQQTIKITINIHLNSYDKKPTFYSEVNLRELFQIGRFSSKKIKLFDQNKNYSGELVLDMLYREDEKKVVAARDDKSRYGGTITAEEEEEIKLRLRREQIEERLRKREDEKSRGRELGSISTLAVLQENQIILPPLRSRKQTIDPETYSSSVKKTKGANIFNSNGIQKFSRSPRFADKIQRNHESFTYEADSEFNVEKYSKRGSLMGKSNKFDFTKVYEVTPGIGRYQIPSLWDKYK